MKAWMIMILAACNAPAVVEDAAIDSGVEEPDSGPPIVLDSGESTDCGILSENDPNNCGGCGRTCIIPHAVAGCAASECTIASCDDGWYDNDGDLGNGCELLDECVEAAPCPTTCGTEGSIHCEGGIGACQVPAELCNLGDDNCDGQCDEGALAGCRVAVHRAYGNGHLYTTDLGFASTPPFNLEAQNYFFMYAAEVPESRPVFLCRKGDGKRLITSSTDCEFAGAMEGTLGYWTPMPSCGTIPLHRLYHGPSDDHFYTLSEAERDNAVTAYGYTAEGIAGYVWPAP